MKTFFIFLANLVPAFFVANILLAAAEFIGLMILIILMMIIAPNETVHLPPLLQFAFGDSDSLSDSNLFSLLATTFGLTALITLYSVYRYKKREKSLIEMLD